MAGPPQHIPAKDLWNYLATAERPSRVVDYPRNHPDTGEPVGEVLMRVLSLAEIMAASAEAEKFTRKTLKDALDANVKTDERSGGYDNIFNNESSMQVLLRACRRADEPTSIFFPGIDRMRTTLTQDETGALMRQYLIVQAELGPIVSKMEPGELQAWIKRLVEGGSAAPLALLSSEAQTALVMHSAYLLYAFWTVTSSFGLQHAASLRTSENPQSKEMDAAFKTVIAILANYMVPPATTPVASEPEETATAT